MRLLRVVALGVLFVLVSSPILAMARPETGLLEKLVLGGVLAGIARLARRVGRAAS